ncbi:MAG: hypothetical protein KGL97_19230, partial [Alphaproteobacteria bacterium]|nr:hypothetical protein [Alphaproteobacteria bacterium]
RFIDRLRSATPVMSEDIALPFDLPSVCRKKVSVGFDGGRLSSDAGVLLLSAAPTCSTADDPPAKEHYANRQIR